MKHLHFLDYYKYPEILQDLTTFNYTLTLPLITNFLWTSKPAHIDYIVQAIQSYFLGGKGIALATEQDLADVSNLNKKKKEKFNKMHIIRVYTVFVNITISARRQLWANQ